MKAKEKQSMRYLTALFVGAAIIGLSASAYAEGGAGEGPKKMFDKKGHHERMIQKFDENKDGQITKDEFIAESEKRFAEIDTDGDGVLTSEELQKHHEARREEMKKKFEEFKGKGGPYGRGGPDGHMPPPMDGDMPPPPPEE